MVSRQHTFDIDVRGVEKCNGISAFNDRHAPALPLDDVRLHKSPRMSIHHVFVA